MNTKNSTKKVQKNDGVSAIAAAAAGVVVGAGVAVAAMVMSDEKNREKLQDAVADAKENALGVVEEGKMNVKKAVNSINTFVKKKVDA